MTTQKTRESWIDVCKGVAIVCVVMGHVVAAYRNVAALNGASVFQFVADFVYSFHMPLFFMVSGLLFGKSSHSPFWKVARKKLVAYGIPYVLFSVLLIGMKFLFARFANQVYSLGDLLAIGLYPMTFLWFLYALLVISLIQLLVDASVGQSAIGKGIVLLASFFACACARYACSLDYPFNLKDLGLMDAAKHYCWFVLGEYCLPHIVEGFRFANKSKLFKPVLFLGFVAYGSVVWLLHQAQSPGIVAGWCMAFVGSILVCLLCSCVTSGSFFEWVGKYTMPIYLLHGFVLAGMRSVLTKLGLPLLGGAIPMVVGTLLGVLVPIAAYGISKPVKCDFLFYPGRYLFKKV